MKLGIFPTLHPLPSNVWPKCPQKKLQDNSGIFKLICLKLQGILTQKIAF